ncbi:MAG: glycosyltransferase [Candidatus Bathyarchaeia archaeon]
MNSLPTVSIVIATRNRLPFLQNCIDSLQTQTYPKELTEIIVVDDGSTDETPHYLRRLAKDNRSVKVINKTHGWQSQARNEGIRASRNELVAIVDDDCTLYPNWLATMVDAMKTSQAHAVGSCIHAPGESLVIQFLDYIRALNPPLLPNGLPKYIVTASGIFRREIFDDVGLFDEQFASSGGEDVEFSIRLNNNRKRLGFSSEGQALHWYTPEITEFLRRYYRYGYGARLAFDKHRMWDYWIPKTDSALQRIVCGEEYGRNFAELDDVPLRMSFGVLHTLKRFCFLAGYLHVRDLSELKLPPYNQDTKTREITMALLAGLSKSTVPLHPQGNAWCKELSPLEQYYQRAFETENVHVWVSHICQMLDWNYILSMAVGVFSSSPVLPSLPDQTLSPVTKSIWLKYHKFRDGAYRRKFNSVTKRYSNKQLKPEEIESICHAYGVDVNRFREWYGNYIVARQDAKIVALWPFWRRPKPRPEPSSNPQPSETGGWGSGYW